MKGNARKAIARHQLSSFVTTTLVPCLLVTLCNIVGTSVYADTLTRSTGAGGADAHTQGSQPNSNFGTNATITARNSNGNAGNFKVYFRLDLSGSGLDLANAISVTLQFTTLTSRNNAGFQFYGLPEGLPGDAVGGWSETGITYNNAPGNVILTDDRNYITASSGDENGNYLQPLGTLTPVTTTVGGVLSFSSPLLLNLVRNDLNGLITIALNRTDNANLIDIASKESTTSYQLPTLVIEANPIPEPSPVTLAAAGFLVLLFRFSAQWKPRR